MLTGRPPFPGGTMLQKLLSHGNSPPPDARLLRSEVSDDLMAVIRKMLAKLPEDRYQNAADLIADLREIANREGLQRTQAVAVPVLAEPSPTLVWLRTHAPWMIAVVLLGGSAAWLQWTSRRARETFRIEVPEVETTAARSAAESGTAGPGDTPPAPLDDSAAGPESAGESVDSTSADGSREISGTGDDPSADPPSGPERMVPTPEQQADIDDGNRIDGADAATPSAGAAPERDAFAPESAGDDGSGRDGTTNAIETIRVVGTDGPIGASDAGAGVAVTRTLTEALELARQRGTRRIEIGVPVLKSGPVVLRQDDMLITSSVGRSTIVLESEDLLSMQRSKMFTIGSNRVRFRDLNFVWRVPVGEVDGGALFVIQPNRLVSMAGCTVTIENRSRRDEVYAFEVLTDPQIDAGSAFVDSAAGEGSDLPLVAINLNDAVVRGEITMLHMDYAAELQLGWKNGLLAVSRRMIDTAGALERPSPTSGSIQLSLERLTAYAPLGLVRMRLGPSGAYPVPIDRNAVASVFAVDKDAPYFEVTGLRSLDREPPLLTLRGESNAYDATKELENPLYRRSAGSDDRRVTLLSAFSPESTRPDWWNERSPHWAVRWSRTEVPEQIPASQLTPADFRQDGLPLRGFDEQSLPPLPPPSAASHAGPASEGPEIDLNLPPIPAEP
jgi:serine/threonine-protein kinase